jgi:hypothetical protein
MQQHDNWPEFGSGRYRVQPDTVVLEEKVLVLEVKQHRNIPGGWSTLY